MYDASGDQWSLTRYVYAVSGSSVWYALPTPRGTKIARDGSSSVVKTAPNVGPSRRSTQAPKMRPVATDTHLSHGSAWMPRVVPTASLNEMLFCTGPKSGRPARGHLLALPVLLEPAAGVAVDGQLPHDEPGDRGLGEP